MLFLCERTSHWAIAWRTVLGDDVRVVEVRTLSQLDEAAGEHPAPLLAIDAFAYSADSLVAALHRWSLRGATIIAHALPSMVDAELLLREAGATHIIYSPRQMETAANIARRHLAARPAVPAEPTSLAEEVERHLPWPRFARRAGF